MVSNFKNDAPDPLPCQSVGKITRLIGDSYLLLVYRRNWQVTTIQIGVKQVRYTFTRLKYPRWNLIIFRSVFRVPLTMRHLTRSKIYSNNNFRNAFFPLSLKFFHHDQTKLVFRYSNSKLPLGHLRKTKNLENVKWKKRVGQDINWDASQLPQGASFNLFTFFKTGTSVAGER